VSALYDGTVKERHLDGGATYQMTLHHRVDGKDYEATRTWRHNRTSEFNTRPPLHSRDSMRWACAFDIDREVAADRKERHEREERARFNEGMPS
jgi:hypothetical protein